MFQETEYQFQKNHEEFLQLRDREVESGERSQGWFGQKEKMNDAQDE